MHEFFAESFDLENTFENILSIQVNLNGFSFSVLNPHSKEVLAFKSSPTQFSSSSLIARRFKEWFQAEEVLQKPFKQTKLIIFSNKYTLLPKNICSGKLKDELAHALFKDGDQLQFAENVLHEIEAKLLFTLPEELLQTINDTIGECKIIHPLKPVLGYILGKSEQNIVVLLFDNRDLTIAVKKDGAFILANHFTVNHVNDVVYYTLTCLKQLHLNTPNTSLIYAGQSSFTHAVDTNLHKHFCSVSNFDTCCTQLSTNILADNFSLFL